MNILLVNTFYYPTIVGGAEISVQKLAEGLVKSGHKVSVLCTDQKNGYEVINGVNVYRIKVKNLYSPSDSQQQNMAKKTIYRFLDFYNIFNYAIIKDIFFKIKPDIVHSNNTYGISPIIWTVAKKFNIPTVHTLRDYYLMYPFGNLTNPEKNNSFNIYELIHKKIHQKVTQKVDYVTAPSRFTLEKFISNNFFTHCFDKEVIFNAIDYNHEIVDQWYKMKSNNKDNITKFVYLGTLGEHKGVHLLLEAFDKIKDDKIELHIAGKGDLQKLVEDYVDKDNRIKFYGFLQGNDLQELLLECNVLVAPSIWFEPFGRVVIDGYKHALPVIGSSTGGLKEIINNNKTGLLIEPNNVEALHNAINTIKDKSIIRDMLEFSRAELNIFSIEEQVKRFENVYNKICDTKSKIRKEN